MTSLVNTAVTAIVASLSSGTPVASQINRVRLRALAANVTQAVVVRPLQTEVTEWAISPGYPVSWATSIAVECYARASAGTTPDVAVDSLVEAVYARLMADPTLGGAVITLQPQGLQYDFDADADQTACATFQFQARQRGGTALFS